MIEWLRSLFRLEQRKETEDEAHAAWIEMARRRGMSFKWCMEAEESYERRKRAVAWAKGGKD